MRGRLYDAGKVIKCKFRLSTRTVAIPLHRLKKKLRGTASNPSKMANYVMFLMITKDLNYGVVQPGSRQIQCLPDNLQQIAVFRTVTVDENAGCYIPVNA